MLEIQSTSAQRHNAETGSTSVNVLSYTKENPESEKDKIQYDQLTD
jgi:hypothetical protein